MRTRTGGTTGMINAPSGSAVGMPPATASSCDAAPAPLVGGGVQSPIQVGVPTAPVAGAGALGAPAASAPATAALGASTLTAVPTGGLFASAPVTLSANTMPATAPAALPGTAPAAIPATSGAAPATATAAAAPAGASAAPQRLTSLAPGGNPGDANLVEQTLGVLRQSPSGAAIVDRMLAVNARINVISDAEFQQMGHGDAHAFYDPKLDAMFLRRSDLSDPQNVRFAAVALAHEGTHLLDDVGKVADPFIDRASQQIAASGGTASPQGAELQKQAMWELMMIKEARAFTFAGQVAKDLQVQTPANDPTSVAAAGANDAATYGKVWQALVRSAYNTEGRSGAPKNF